MFQASLQLNGIILKRTKCILVAWILLCAVPVEAQVANLPPYTNFWHRFVSSDEAFSMSLFFAEGGEVNGYYYYHNSEVKHPIRGRFDNKMLSLYQEKNGISSSFLYGKITNEDNAIFSGFRVDSALNKKSFRFQCETISGGSYDHQYEKGAPFGKDDEVEDFARMVIHKIQAGDRNWVVNHLSYPFFTLMGTKRVAIKSKQECLSVYDKMVTKDFLDLISEKWESVKIAIANCFKTYSDESFNELADALGIADYNEFDCAYIAGAFVFEVLFGIAIAMLTGGASLVAQAATKTRKLALIMRIAAAEVFSVATMGVYDMIELLRSIITAFCKAAARGIKSVNSFLKELRKGKIIDVEKELDSAEKTLNTVENIVSALEPNQVKLADGTVVTCKEVIEGKEIKMLLPKASSRERLKNIEGLRILENDGLYFLKYNDGTIFLGNSKQSAKKLEKYFNGNTTKSTIDAIEEQVKWEKELEEFEKIRIKNPDTYWKDYKYTDLFPPPEPPKKPCFLRYTQVEMENGMFCIEDIKVGDLVYAYDFELKRSILKPVTATYKNYAEKYVRITLNNYYIIEATGQHLFWIEAQNEWVKAKDLEVEMMLFATNKFHKKNAKIRRLKVIEEKVDTYNLEVADLHNYLVGQLLSIVTHNGRKKISKFASKETSKVAFYSLHDADEIDHYVGQTAQSIKVRFAQHKNDKKKAEWIRNMLAAKDIRDGYKEMTAYEAAVLEIYEINKRGGIKILKNKSIPIGEKKFQLFKKEGFNPCRFD